MATVHIRLATPAAADTVAPLFDAYRQFYEQAPDLAGAKAFIAERLEREESVILLALLRRMARPGMALGHAALWLALPPLVLWAMALWALSQVSAAERMPLILGSTWRTCPFNIAALSVPAFVAGLSPIHLSEPPRTL